ncbi:MAG TPA: hypothetical protein VGJ93_11220 [Desulfuromonadaceae bacterium]
MIKGLQTIPLLLFLFLIAGYPPANAATDETVVVTGQISDIDGKPVAGAELFVYDSEIIRRPADFISPRTGKDGRYRLILQRRNYWAVARVRSGDKFGPLLPGDRHSGEPQILETQDSAELQQNFIVVDIREAVRQKQKVRSDYQKISGRITSKKGSALPERYVFAGQDPTVHGLPEYISAWSDAGGGFTLYLPPGHYYLGISDHFPPPDGLKTDREINLEPGKHENNLEIVGPE